MTQLRLLFSQQKNRYSLAALAATAVVTTAAATSYHNGNVKHSGSGNISGSNTKCEENTSSQRRRGHIGIIETNFTDRLASKPYLNYHNPYARDSLMRSTINSSRRLWSKFARNDHNANPTVVGGLHAGDSWTDDSGALLARSNVRSERPIGVPRRIRIMAIDVPEFREVFDGECKVNLSRVYPDDIAPPKFIPRRSLMIQDRKNNVHVAALDETSNESKDDNNVSSSSLSSSSSSSSSSSPPSKKKTNSNTTVIASNRRTKKEEQIEIMQKSLARCLVRCRNEQSKRIGVELLEASIYDLNPSNMRRTYQFGSYRYDPGKYMNGGGKTRGGGEAVDNMLQRRMSVNENIGIGRRTYHRNRNLNRNNMVVTKNEEQDDNANANANANDSNVEQESSTVEYADVEEEYENDDNSEAADEEEHNFMEKTVLAMEEDEVDAPWNQYAWIEEMQLRIDGRIPFGANAERASWLSRTLFGNSYRQTVKASRSFLHWFVPSFLSGEKVGGEEGIDGDYGGRAGSMARSINRSSSKPHAVIADGSAMQRVPGSLRYLTKCCKEADVPLFIINDPRVWGGNTNKDLESAAKDIRKTIKSRIVASALTIKEGSMFERGRVLGKLEAETKWQIKDAGRRTRQAVIDAAARIQKERDDDWSKLKGKELLQRLIAKNVISLEGEKLLSDVDNASADAFGEICKQYLKQIANKKEREEESDTNVTTATTSEVPTSENTTDPSEVAV